MSFKFEISKVDCISRVTLLSVKVSSSLRFAAACNLILARGNDISFRPLGFFDLHSGISFDSDRINEARPYSY